MKKIVDLIVAYFKNLKFKEKDIMKNSKMIKT